MGFDLWSTLGISRGLGIAAALVVLALVVGLVLFLKGGGSRRRSTGFSLRDERR